MVFIVFLAVLAFLTVCLPFYCPNLLTFNKCPSSLFLMLVCPCLCIFMMLKNNDDKRTMKSVNCSCFAVNVKWNFLCFDTTLWFDKCSAERKLQSEWKQPESHTAGIKKRVIENKTRNMYFRQKLRKHSGCSFKNQFCWWWFKKKKGQECTL